jgi:multidrug efflux pump subunit AcrB
LRGKGVKEVGKNFVFRVKMGEYEVEIGGSREEVLKTIEELPSLAVNVHKAFESLKPKTVATLTVRKEGAKEEALMQKYPKILRSEKCDEAVLRILESDWGKWRPRTVAELKDALKANELNFSAREIAAALLSLVRKGVIRRWKTDAGQVYILAEKEELTK